MKRAKKHDNYFLKLWCWILPRGANAAKRMQRHTVPERFNMDPYSVWVGIVIGGVVCAVLGGITVCCCLPRRNGDTRCQHYFMWCRVCCWRHKCNTRCLQQGPPLILTWRKLDLCGTVDVTHYLHPELLITALVALSSDVRCTHLRFDAHRATVRVKGRDQPLDLSTPYTQGVRYDVDGITFSVDEAPTLQQGLI